MYLKINNTNKPLASFSQVTNKVAFVFSEDIGSEDFADVSKIDIVNANLKTVGNETGAIAQSGIIAFIHDIDSCASIITRFRDYSYPNNRDESMNIIKKADKGYMVDLSENAVVFYVADAA